jgi:hypothetical protein
LSLYNTHLQFSNGRFRIVPVNFRPCGCAVKRCTQFPVHLLFSFRKFCKFSCKERPHGSLPAFAWDNVIRYFTIQSLSAPLQSGVRFFHVPLPAPPPAHLTVGFPAYRGEDTGLPRSA